MSFDNNQDGNSRNFIIAIVLFMAIMFGFEHFSSSKQSSAEQQSTEQSDANSSSTEASTDAAQDEVSNNAQADNEPETLTLEDALKKENTISVENSHMVGVIDLNGGTIDSVTLKDYKDSVEKNSKNVMLLTPRKTPTQFFYLITYNDKTNNEIISERTVWTSDNFESGNQTAIIKTQTQNGIVIERSITLDDGYITNIKDRIINVSSKNIRLSSKGELIRSNPPSNNYAVVHEGLVWNAFGKVDDTKYGDIKGQTELPNCNWLGYTDIYWLCSVLNKNNSASVSYGKTDDDSFKISTKFKKDINLAPNAAIELNYSLFTGPKDITVLKNYRDELNLDKFDMAIDFGWFFMITKPLIQLMDLLAKIFSNMGVVVLILTLMFKIITYPLTKKSFASAARMKEIQPKVAALQKSYAHDKARLNQEMMALYKKEKVSPMSGCLPMLLQAPIFFCLYKVFFISIEMRHAPLFGWIHDLSAPDQLYIANLFGAFDWTPPKLLQIGVWPLIMGLSMFLQQKLTTSNKASKTVERTSEQKIQENMMLFLPLMFTYICSSFPVGVVIYWTISNVFTMLQQLYTNKKVRTKSN